MQLPDSERLDVAKLSSAFSNTTNSYKFYWLLAILDCLAETGQTQLSMRDLSLRMVAMVWYPLDYFKLSFGKQDGFKPIADYVSQLLTVDNSTNAPTLFLQLQSRLTNAELEQVYRKVKILLDWVPYRFIRPFFAQETRGLLDYKVNNQIVELANKSQDAPYRFLGEFIEINEDWAAYFSRHLFILRGFTCWHLVRFLQKNNPNVTGLTEKLDKPAERDLKQAGRFWKGYLAENPGMSCIYSGQAITTSNLSLDHFLPWTFVAHDQLWNIVPTPKSVNSAKNDWLPSLDLYFDRYAQLQHKGFSFYVKKGNQKILEDYHVLFAQNVEFIRQQSFTDFKERLARQIMPHLQTAQNLGFSHPFIYKKP
ncbi:HNH endonuclease domain-containing protein [Spirosoma spitsbergense]|uniref:HNH endonuclease domain-containing protein n=1 Tax=Spirosoma spitsbergense TaxID=431554 RepID=UPI00037C1FC1|nr:HNH endonuclease domain-containing protein [Spirosoma spitsbergense]